MRSCIVFLISSNVSYFVFSRSSKASFRASYPLSFPKHVFLLLVDDNVLGNYDRGFCFLSICSRHRATADPICVL